MVGLAEGGTMFTVLVLVVATVAMAILAGMQAEDLVRKYRN